MFSAGAGVFFPGAGVFLPEPEVKNPEFAQHYTVYNVFWNNIVFTLEKCRTKLQVLHDNLYKFICCMFKKFITDTVRENHTALKTDYMHCDVSK